VLDVAARTGAKILAGGQTQGTNPLVQEIRRIVLRGNLGPLRAINMWAYTNWMLRPREAHEVDDSLGGGIVWRQAPHQLETIRWLGGGLVRSVRAVTGQEVSEQDPDILTSVAQRAVVCLGGPHVAVLCQRSGQLQARGRMSRVGVYSPL
jgi:predicted dehydrogenase